MNYDIACPKPASMIESLRSVGYNLATAIADILDNSLAAHAKNVWLDFLWAGDRSCITMRDDGCGMTEDQLVEAMRPGSRSPLESRDPSDLGRFGLGLKTASFSQCRKLTVLSRVANADIAFRMWDLDYVTIHNEWRLLRTADSSAEAQAEQLSSMPSGTVVCWSVLDRITRGENPGDAAAQTRFNTAIDHVEKHLAMTFHRFIEDHSVRIHINGRTIGAWNPFLEHHTATYRTPEEVIPFGDSKVRFRGYVLPHKDMLSEEEIRQAAGPSGWVAHQGFYVYRSRRLLVPGDWLRLGRPSAWTKQEHCNLARIQLDLPNDTDAQWHLDVKKSTARPPSIIRDRLTELAESVRERARSVFAHRGRYGTRMPAVQNFTRPWESAKRGGSTVYRINRSHPAVKAVLELVGDRSPEVNSLLRVLEETVPVQQIWLDMAEQVREPAPPFYGVEFSVLRADIRRAYEFLLEAGIGADTARAQLSSIEPYNRYPELLAEL